MSTQATLGEIIPGKFYVIDQFASSNGPGPVSGPFDTREEAEAERRQLNCADDCFVAQKR